jgi:hypothetical protein
VTLRQRSGRGLRLPFIPQKPQELDRDETDFIEQLCRDHLTWVEHEKSKGLVSESVLRTEMYAEDVLAKIKEAKW